MLLFLNLGLLLGGLEVEVAVGYLETKFPQNFPNFHWGVLWQSMKQVVEVSRAEQLLSDDQRQLLALQRQARWRSCWGLLETYFFWLATVEAFFREFKQKETGVFFWEEHLFFYHDLVTVSKIFFIFEMIYKHGSDGFNHHLDEAS